MQRQTVPSILSRLSSDFVASPCEQASLANDALGSGNHTSDRLPLDMKDDDGAAIAPLEAIQERLGSRLATFAGDTAGRIINTIAQLDLAAVRQVSASAQNYPLRILAVILSRLGNGGIYVFLPILIFARFGANACDIVVIASCNIIMLHAFYPALKRRIGRPRPYEVDREVKSLSHVLDEHSFPSGHVMTLSAALTPVVLVDPGLTAHGIGLLVAMGWARLATGHHYLTDVIAGALLALLVSVPLTAIWLSVY